MNKKSYVPFFLIAMLLLAACVPVPVVKAQPNLENTQQAATATAIFTNTTSTPIPAATEIPALTLPQLPTAAPTQLTTATPTLLPTATPTQLPTATPTPTFAPTAVPAPCNLGYLVGDVTIPDGTILNPGDSFIKTWRLENVGACTWTSSYSLVFTNGDLMSAPSVVQLPGNVAPGQTIDLSISMVAPLSAGTYQGYWMLRDPNGNLFGVGSYGSQNFWVQIVVYASAEFAVTKVHGSVSPASYNGICPVTFNFHDNIWTNGAGTVTFYWLRSDGSTGAEGSLYYSGSGYQTVYDSWSLGTPGASISAWDEIVIQLPNQESYTPINITLTCAPNTPTPTTVPTQTPTPTLTPTLPAPTPTPTQPAPTPTPTLPAPTPTPTLPAPTPTPTQPAPTPTPTQPAPTPTPTQPAPTPTPTQPAPTPTPTQPAPTPDANTACADAHANTASADAHANSASADAHANTASADAHANTASADAHANSASADARRQHCQRRPRRQLSLRRPPRQLSLRRPPRRHSVRRPPLQHSLRRPPRQPLPSPQRNGVDKRRIVCQLC